MLVFVIAKYMDALAKLIDTEIPAYLNTLTLKDRNEWLYDLEGLNEDAINIIQVKHSRGEKPFAAATAPVSLKPHTATKKQLEYFALFKKCCVVINDAIEKGVWNKQSLMYLEHVYYQLKFYEEYANNSIGKYIGNKLNTIAKNNIKLFQV